MSNRPAGMAGESGLLRYHSLDVLRGLAAMWVFTFHYPWSEAARDGMPGVMRFTSNGAMEVPVFFVISGYCVVASARKMMNSGESAGAFLRRRLWRIYPPFWLSIVLILSMPLALAAAASLKQGTPVMPELSGTAMGPLDWLGVVSLTRIFRTDIPSLWKRFAEINGVYWSLAIEVQFYLVVALAMRWPKRFYAILAWTTVLAFPFTFPEWSANTGLFLSMWIQFAFGVAVFFCFERGITPHRIFGRAAAVVSGMAVLSIIGLLLAVIAVGDHLGATSVAVGCAIAIWFGGAIDPLLERLRKTPRASIRFPVAVLFVFGAMSYSLYLTHTVLPAIPRLALKRVVPSNSITSDFLILAVACLICYPFHLWCEAPFIRRRAAGREMECQPLASPLPAVSSLDSR